MYKCDVCGQFNYITIVSKGQACCMECLSGDNDTIEGVKPPLGWMGDFHESEVMFSYGQIGTRYFKGRVN